MARTFNRGFNAALRAIRQSIAHTLTAGGLSDEQRAALASVAAMCRQMRQRTRPKPRLATLATRYGVSLRTVKNWKRQGCPFAKGQKAVLGWMLRRHTLPAGPRRKFAREFAEMEFADAAKATLDTGRGIYPESDLGTRALLSHRFLIATQAAERLEVKQLLKRPAVTRLCAMIKTAKRAGLWE